jgi:hypothetical protein
VEQPEHGIILPACFLEREVQVYLKNMDGGEDAVQARCNSLGAAFHLWRDDWLATQGAAQVTTPISRSRVYVLV